MMAILPSTPTSEPYFGSRIVRRIEWFILAYGCIAAITAVLLRGWDWAAGVSLGAAVCWANFRWMKRGLASVLGLGSADSNEDNTPKRAGAGAALLRYALMALSAYVIFKYLHFPLVSVVGGLCLLAPAVLTASFWEIFQSSK